MVKALFGVLFPFIMDSDRLSFYLYRFQQLTKFEKTKVMEKEILFKAKRVDNGEWVEGFYYLDPEDGHYIHDFEYILDNGNFDEPPHGYFQRVYFQVHPETVCQFTGLLDKNGNKIFEGDIAKASHPNLGSTIGCIVYNCEFCRFEVKMKVLANWDFQCIDEIEITGSIHDK